MILQIFPDTSGRLLEPLVGPGGTVYIHGGFCMNYQVLSAVDHTVVPEPDICAVVQAHTHSLILEHIVMDANVPHEAIMGKGRPAQFIRTNKVQAEDTDVETTLWSPARLYFYPGNYGTLRFL